MSDVKLVDVIRVVPPTSSTELVVLINKTREMCFNSEEIHPLTRQQRQFEQLDKYCQLLPSPRHLQRSLRSTYIAWKRIPGEVNWSDLFILKSLEVIAPAIYKFVLFHYDQLVSGRHDLEKHWDKILDYARLTPYKEQFTTLLQFCFPRFGKQSPKRGGWVVQSISTEKYLWRAVNEVLGINDVSDQMVLWDLGKWFNGNEKPIRKHVGKLGDNYIEVVKDWMTQFADYKGDKQRLAALRELVDG